MFSLPWTFVIGFPRCVIPTSTTSASDSSHIFSTFGVNSILPAPFFLLARFHRLHTWSCQRQRLYSHVMLCSKVLAKFRKLHKSGQEPNILGRLPAELLAIIFIFGAIDNTQTALSVSQVCRQSRVWTLGILYRTVVLTNYSALAAFADIVTADPSLGLLVHHLWIGTKNPHPNLLPSTFYRQEPTSHTTKSRLRGLLKSSNNPSQDNISWSEEEEKAMKATISFLQHCPNLHSLAVLVEGPSRMFDNADSPPLPFHLTELTSPRGIPSLPNEPWRAVFQTLRRIYSSAAPWNVQAFTQQLPYFIEGLQSLEHLEIHPTYQRDSHGQWVNLYWFAQRAKYFQAPEVSFKIRVEMESEIPDAFQPLLEKIQVVADVPAAEEQDCSFIFDEWILRRSDSPV